MKQIWKDLLFSCMMGLLVPALILGIAAKLTSIQDSPEEPTVTQIYQQEEEIIIAVLTEKGVEQMLLDDYLTGVVLAEMPAYFESEAHKAQAVVARTYTMRAHLKKPRHENASVCTDSACCQGYISPQDYLDRGGTKENIKKIQDAVVGTSGLVLCYEGELIEATYFSCSGGYTEDAVAVWGTDVPYLQSVSSPGEEEAAHYSDTVFFSVQEFREKLSLPETDHPERWVRNIIHTNGGGVSEIVICELTFRGTEIRKLLNLRSTAFEINYNGTGFEVKTRGFGHRVGMSQYGADAMAASGSDFREILTHYYQGTQLEQIPD